MTDFQDGAQELGTTSPGTGLMGFDSAPASVAVSEREAGAVAAVAREEAEIKAAIVVAKQCPRDEAAAFAKLTRAARRPSFADGARYSFKRGSSKVEGPSVKMAREIARCWGNVRYGVRIVSFDDEFVHVKGFAVDLESNTYVDMEDKFRPLVQRKVNGVAKWVSADERDLRELINRRGAICVRNAILQIMPPDVVDEIMGAVKDTQVRAAKGEIDVDRDKAVRSIVISFEDMGVTSKMLEEYLEHPLQAIDANELADLRSVFKSIRDGNTKRDEHFQIPGSTTGQKPSLNEELKARRDATESGNSPESRNGQSAGPASDAQILKLTDLRAKGIASGAITPLEVEGFDLVIHERKAEQVERAIADVQASIARHQAAQES